MRRVFLFISFEVVARGLGVVLDLVAQGGGVGEAALVADEVVELHPHAVVVEVAVVVEDVALHRDVVAAGDGLPLYPHQRRDGAA